MDDFDDLWPSEFVTDTDDQDSLDERIDTEQRLRNQQLWASFQNAACCITKLYKDRTQPNVSHWIPFQNAASNLTTLYKDCIESQRRFAKIGYQVGRRRKLREFKKLLKKHKTQAKQNQSLQQQQQQQPQQQSPYIAGNIGHNFSASTATTLIDSSFGAQETSGQQQQQQNVASILAVNQLNIDCDDSPSDSMQTQSLFVPENNHRQHNHNQQQQQQQQNPSSNTQTSIISNNEEDLVTFQQALVQPAVISRSTKSGANRRPCLNASGYLTGRTIDPSKSEEDRLLELNQFLSEEYHRHVGSRKRSCSSNGGNLIKRIRD